MALAIYDRVIEARPEYPQAYLAFAHAPKTVGRVEEGVESYRSAHRVCPGFGDAYWRLANPETYRITDAEMDQIRDQIERRDTATEHRYHPRDTRKSTARSSCKITSRSCTG